MHMADALVMPAVAVTMYAASGIAAGYSVRKVHLEQDTRKVPLMGIMGAFVFAAQMINFSIPGTGSSGHLCGGLLLSALVGPWAGFLCMTAILSIQCLLFADGGLLALGCNIWNMAFYACFIGFFCVYQPIIRRKMTKCRLMVSSILACMISLQLGAFSVALETLISGVTELPFGAFLAAMQPIHLAIGLAEGLITGAVLIFVYETRAELVTAQPSRNKLSYPGLLTILSATVILIGGGMSILASSDPDGLEWSIQRLTGSTEVENQEGIQEVAADIQEKTALFPDYQFSGRESTVGTSVSGIVGAGLVAAVCIGGLLLFKCFKKKDSSHEVHS